jgi:hypothetical protein
MKEILMKSNDEPDASRTIYSAASGVLNSAELQRTA